MRTAQPGLCRFAFSSDVGALVRCRIDQLLPRSQAEDLIGDEPLDIEVDLLLDGRVVCTSQSSKAVGASPEQGAFRQQQFVFAIKVRDLPVESHFSFRLRSAQDGLPSLRRGVLPLFNDRGVLRQGRRLVALLPEDGSTPSDGSAPWVGAEIGGALDSNEAAVRWVQATAAPGAQAAAQELAEALRMEEALELRRRGWIPSSQGEEAFAGAARTVLENSGLPWLCIQLPEFQHPVVFAEPQYGQDIELPPGVLAASRAQEVDQRDLDALQDGTWLLRPLRAPDPVPSVPVPLAAQGRSFKCFIDHGALDHPALQKSLRLGRSSRAMVKDKDVRPSAEQLKRLAEVVRRPRRHLSSEEKDLLFRFRWSLTDQPGALTKFLHAVEWRDMEERNHAIELLGHWSPVDIDDALELLSKDFQGLLEVRRHAVQRLETASDADLQLYLLQLVQALRYEPEVDEGGQAFLIRRAVNCTSLATLLYWYVVAEIDEGESGGHFDMVRQQLLAALENSPGGTAPLMQQVMLRKKLLWALQFAKAKRDRIEKKIERFRQALVSTDPPGEGSEGMDLVRGLKAGIPLPVDPSLSLVGVLPEECSLLKSAMSPGVLACQVRQSQDPHGKVSIKKVMVKEGDDLRQDQLVLQLIILMDSILKRYGLDLQLTPYQVIALSRNDGMVDFVPNSANLSKVLKEHNNDIQQFFRTHHPAKASGKEDQPAWGPQNSYGIKAEVLENFVRSCAGYCVITYILGIGDRHLDNLMVTKDGRLFHIDFGFILGKDPKPFPPPMRICKEMVEGMGGNSSPGYQSFKSKCCQAFKILRRHSKLIINLLYLMTDSGIKDICSDPQFAILKVEQKFQALMDDEQAEEHFLNLIDESVSALMPVLMEFGHKISIAMQHATVQLFSFTLDRSEEELRKVVLQMAATGGGWPAAVRERLMMALRAPCEATACSPPLALEVDERYTAARATSSGSLHQALLSLGAMTGIPLLRERAELYRSQPASVILSSSGITQSRDCFAFRGPNASVALRLRPGQVARQLVIEQPPRWAARRVKTMPRRFAVFGAKEDSRWTNPYSEFLGHFEYVAAGPAVQAFELPSTPLEGLRVVFAGPEWGESYICLYRLKVFEDTACSGGRVASAIPS
ncbi:unnamed protein product [Effrenium voratum]|nr:unnamed protein product [Effrenium voratum]